MKVAALDFETANSQRHSACALGVTIIENQQIIETQYWLFKPVGGFDYMNTAVHGITMADVYNKPSFAASWGEIQDYINNRLLIAHNAAFDMSVLRQTLEYYNLKKPIAKYGCTMRMAKKLWPQHENHRLNTLCHHFNFQLNHHNAASDALACARIGLELCKAKKVTSFESLLQTEKNFAKVL